jgi:hypothetical protein
MLAALYWGPRKETRRASLACWHKTCALLAQAGLQHPALVADMRDDDASEDSPQTGYRYSWKSPGKLPEQLSLHVLCGAWASATNAVLLNLPEYGADCFDKKAADYLWTFSELIEVWDPLEGIVCLHEDVAWTGGRLSAALPCVRRYRRGGTITLQ